jgi:hypothetical protein
MKTFRLAPMTTDLRLMTVAVLLAPVFMAVIIPAKSGPARLVMLSLISFCVVLYLTVWCWWRPSRFEVSPQGLTIVWPLRSRTIAAHALREVSLVSREDFRREYKYMRRFGAGGLWGGFGLLVTAKGTLAMYISRTDAFVLIHRQGERPLLITPEQPDSFIQELRALVPAR